jgi:hypothetical protein
MQCARGQDRFSHKILNPAISASKGLNEKPLSGNLSTSWGRWRSAASETHEIAWVWGSLTASGWLWKAVRLKSLYILCETG